MNTNSACELCDLNKAADLKKLGNLSGKYDYAVALAGNPNTGKKSKF